VGYNNLYRRWVEPLHDFCKKTDFEENEKVGENEKDLE
jgi:hypothetical protein